MSIMDLISFGALFLIVISIIVVVFRLSKLAQEEKKHSILRKSLYNKQFRTR